MKLRSILIQYRIVFYLLSPLILLYTVIMALRHRDRRYLAERYGFYKEEAQKQVVWIHAASVGEVIAALPLVEALAACRPDDHFILSSGTPTGGEIARQRLPQNIHQAYLPLDLPGSVKRFLKHYQPKCAIIMETELWANLYYACHENNIPITIVNARLSQKTLKASAWMYRLYAETLSHVKRILARSEEDANGFMTIGATSSKIRVIGNIKMAPVETAEVETLAELDRPYVLAASTHDNEEEQIARMWLQHFPDTLLVIAPRHPVRRKKIVKQLRRLSPHYQLRSEEPLLKDGTLIYLADTLGEMNSLLKGAEMVIMGGSFVPVGGHNVIEPARLGKAILFGPHMHNFRDEAKLLLEHQACLQVKNVEELGQVVKELEENVARRERLAGNALKMIDGYQDIIERYVEALETSYDKYQPEMPFLQTNQEPSSER